MNKTPKLWGTWTPNVSGKTGRVAIGQKDGAEVFFSNITFEEYLEFVNWLQKDLALSRTLLNKMGIQKKGEKTV